MKVKALTAALAALCATAMIVASVAVAGGVTVVASPNPTTVGSTFEVEICGLGGKTADYRITASDGVVVKEGQIYAPGCGTISVVLEQAGTYTIEVLNKNGNKVFASTSETVV